MVRYPDRTASSLLRVPALLIVAALAWALPSLASEPGVPQGPAPWVAHAGGGLDGERYWNSLEALEVNYARGFRDFELDFHWSGDGRLALIHDWGRTFDKHFAPWEASWLKKGIARLAGGRPRPPLDVFLELGAARGFTPLSLERLAAWLERRPDAWIITDVKRENLRALSRIRQRYPRLARRIVPQVYRFGEYDRVKALGYPRIILTLYRMKASEDEIAAFAEKVRPWAVAMPRRRAMESGLVPRLSGVGVFVYVHTINDAEEARRLIALGAGGVYTDFLQP